MPDQPNLLYDRDVRTRVFHEGPDALRAVATLKDDSLTPFGYGTVHEMRLEVWLDRPSLEITAVDAGMDHHPQQACPFTTHRMRELVGLSIRKGYVAELHARFGGNRGCNHLLTMAQSIGTTVAMASRWGALAVTAGMVMGQAAAIVYVGIRILRLSRSDRKAALPAVPIAQEVV